MNTESFRVIFFLGKKIFVSRSYERHFFFTSFGSLASKSCFFVSTEIIPCFEN